MKKRSIFVFLVLSFLVISSFSVFAGLIHRADFSKTDEDLVIELHEKDALVYVWEDSKEHKLVIDSIKEEGYKVSLTSFIEGYELPYYTTLTPSISLNLDFDRDNVVDLVVRMYDIDLEANTVTLVLEKQKEGMEKITGAGAQVRTEPGKGSSVVWVTAALIIIGIVIYLLFRKK